MKKGYFGFLILVILVLCFFLGMDSVIFAEDDPSLGDTTSVEQMQESQTTSSVEDNQTDTQTNNDERIEQRETIPEYTAKLEVIEVDDSEEYDAILSGVPDSVFNRIVFKVWSDQNDENDVYVYIAEKQDNGSFSSRLMIKNHKHLGLFHIVAFGVYNNDTIADVSSEKSIIDILADQDSTVELATASFETRVPQGGIVSASSDCAKGIIIPKLEGLENNNLVREVRFHIWSKNNQSDLTVYSINSKVDGLYTASVSLKDYLNSPGVYQIRVYSVDVLNNMRFHGKATVNMLASTSALNIPAPSGNTPFRTITATGVEAPCGVRTVRFAVWSDAGGQDDLKWYTASAAGSTYTYTVDVRNHKSVGLYNVQVYIVSMNGVSQCTKTGSFSVTNADLKPNPIQGIDVSKHNGTIDWAKVKGAGIKYAIIRCGYGDNIVSQDDTQWTRNVTQCESLGIPYGVYIYSYATNVSQAKSEAEHCIRLLKGHHPQYPVFLDLEDDCMSELSNAQLLQITVTWAEKIRAAGYTPGVYSSKYWWTTRLTSSNYDNYKRWVAQWSAQCTYTGTYCMWQYSSTGKVNGISGNVDMNYAY